MTGVEFRIKQQMKLLGHNTYGSFCNHIGITYAILKTAMKNPVLANGENYWNTAARRVADALGLDIRWLFQEFIPDLRIDLDWAVYYPPTLEDKRDLELLSKMVTKQLLSLTIREERILRLRLGLNVEEETLEQVAVRYGVNRERIRQIEQKALRKLKHPSRSRKLRHFAGYAGIPDEREENRLCEEFEKLVIEKVKGKGVSIETLLTKYKADNEYGLVYHNKLINEAYQEWLGDPNLRYKYINGEFYDTRRTERTA